MSYDNLNSGNTTQVIVWHRICLQTDGRTWWNQYTPPGVENLFWQAQAQGFLNFFNPSPVSERIPFIFDDFHFCRSRVIGLDMTENRIFTLCRMITWVVFFRMFWNFISSLLVKRGGSLSFLTIYCSDQRWKGPSSVHW
jgi:hypothetical protein